eukprot:COSAG02_NODE_696_length_18385_cov_48.260855_11_plen_110_part_00
MDAAAQEDVELGRLIIDVSIRDNLEAEFTIVAPRSTENRSVIAGLAMGENISTAALVAGMYPSDCCLCGCSHCCRPGLAVPARRIRQWRARHSKMWHWRKHLRPNEFCP